MLTFGSYIGVMSSATVHRYPGRVVIERELLAIDALKHLRGSTGRNIIECRRSENLGNISHVASAGRQ